MALFKVNRGNSTTLPKLNQNKNTDGWAYFCTDTGEFYIDYKNSNNVLQRRLIKGDPNIAISKSAPEQGDFWIDISEESGEINEYYTKAEIDALLANQDTTYTKAEIDAFLSNKAPAYTYGTTDLTAGTSALGTGMLYFVYE